MFNAYLTGADPTSPEEVCDDFRVGINDRYPPP